MRKNVLILTLSFAFLNLLSAQEWQTDFSEAKKIATTENKPIILVFQGSDWCAPCIKLDKEIWSTEYFKEFASKNYVMLQADFPKRKKNILSEEQSTKNATLFEKYNKSGIFPFVVVMDSLGIVLGETSYKKTTPKEYIALLESF